MEITIAAPAKINLSLDVFGVRPDGYHEIATVMQAISVFDCITIRTLDSDPEEYRLKIRAGGNGISPKKSIEELPLGHENLAIKALFAFREVSGIKLPVEIKILKHIPVSAGLGGGSADAAAVIYGLNALSGFGLGVSRLCDIGAMVGSDVPFFFYGGTALGKGRGEQIRPLSYAGDWHVLIVKPPVKVSTAAIYKSFDLFPGSQRAARTEAVVSAIERFDFDALCGSVGNDLQPVTTAEFPIVGDIVEKLKSAGARGVCQSGSGPSVFAITRTAAEAESLANCVRGVAESIFIARFYSGGVRECR